MFRPQRSPSVTKRKRLVIARRTNVVTHLQDRPLELVPTQVVEGRHKGCRWQRPRWRGSDRWQKWQKVTPIRYISDTSNCRSTMTVCIGLHICESTGDCRVSVCSACMCVSVWGVESVTKAMLSCHNSQWQLWRGCCQWMLKPKPTPTRWATWQPSFAQLEIHADKEWRGKWRHTHIS